MYLTVYLGHVLPFGVQRSHLSLVLISLQPHHPHPQMSWYGCKKMWKLDRPFRSLTAEDNLWLSTVIKAREAGGENSTKNFPISISTEVTYHGSTCLLLP